MILACTSLKIKGFEEQLLGIGMLWDRSCRLGEQSPTVFPAEMTNTWMLTCRQFGAIPEYCGIWALAQH
jgi:hypothetical protein